MKTEQIYHIVIVDDHLLFAESLAKLIDSFDEFKVLFLAGNGSDLQRKMEVHKVQPDVILLDLNMPVMNGIETMSWLNKNHPEVKVLALTMEDEKKIILHMIRNGARGYLLKNIAPADFKSAILEVINKGFYYSEKVNKALLSVLQKATLPKIDIPLKESELAFIKLACTEMTYKEIADKMNLSPKTIDGYRQDLFARFKVKNRVGLVMYAMKHRLID